MLPLSRREFLKHSAALSAAMAAPGLVLSEEKAKKKISANETLNVAVVGVNGRGMSHVGGLTSKLGCRITTICDCDTAVIGKAMSAVEKETGQTPKFEQDFRKVVEDKSIDVISIATPNHWHSLMAIWAIQNGKDVYLEKPVSHNVWEGRKIVEAARKYNRICQTGTQCRSNPANIQAMEFINSGKLGKLKIARGLCYKPRGSIGTAGGPQPIPKTIDYDLWCGPREVEPLTRKKLHYDWHWVWAFGNGDLGNQGIHQMDIARWGIGKKQLSDSVMSLGGRFSYEDDGETANTQVAWFGYGDADLIFEVRGLKTDGFASDLGKKGTHDRTQAKVGVVFELEDGYVIMNGYNTGVAVDKDWQPVAQFNGGSDGLHYDNFVKAVRSRKAEDLTADIEEGHLSSALCHLANISMRLGKQVPLAKAAEACEDKASAATVERMNEHLKANNVDLNETLCLVGPKLAIDPKSETFLGSQSKANGMLKGEYRKGFEISEEV